MGMARGNDDEDGGPERSTVFAGSAAVSLATERAPTVPDHSGRDQIPAIWISVCIIWLAVLITLELAW